MKKGLIVLTLILLVAVVTGLTAPAGVSVTGKGRLGLETHVALAVQQGKMGDGSTVPQQIEAIPRRGGPPVVSIVFDDPIDEEEDALTIHWNGIPTSHVKKSVLVKKKQGQGEVEAEAEAEAEAEGQVREQSLEIWTLLSLFPLDDPVMQDPPILLDNERIEKYRGKWYLITTLCYIDIHIFTQDPLKFTVKINGLDAGPITGEWWTE